MSRIYTTIKNSSRQALMDQVHEFMSNNKVLSMEIETVSDSEFSADIVYLKPDISEGTILKNVKLLEVMP